MTKREKLAKQLGEHIAGVVEGYAAANHMSPDVAEHVVMQELEGIVARMKGDKKERHRRKWRNMLARISGRG